MDCYKNIEIVQKSIQSDLYMVLIYFPVKKLGRFLNYITYIGMDKLFPILMSTYIVIYGTPKFGGHHFSLGAQPSSEHTKAYSRKPKWEEDLAQNKSVLDLDAVVLAINCAAASASFFEEQVSPDKPALWFHCVCMFITLIWKLLARMYSFTHGGTCVFDVVKSCTGQSFFKTLIPEKTSLYKHSTWLSVIVDLLLGNLFGLGLLTHADSVCLLIFTITSDITNNWWLISCARLMGNLAGFKLNTELAGVLGNFSLNAIQFWSTLWGSLRVLFIVMIKGLAISGVLFGFTTPAALTVDVITLSTTHVSTLHWLIFLLYSRHIQATTALRRLFRGQKWNPLRERSDSYDYTVEQHIVGSLLFTPLLLLLPTTSAFYMSFTIMNMTIGFVCTFIEVAISVIHATPYTKIVFWLLRPCRFPRGIWFKISSIKQDEADIMTNRSDVLLSTLHSYHYNIGELVLPHFRYLLSAMPRSSIRTSVYRVLSGRSLASPPYNFQFAPGAGLPTRLQWMSLPINEYWILCHDAIFACIPFDTHTHTHSLNVD